MVATDPAKTLADAVAELVLQAEKRAALEFRRTESDAIATAKARKRREASPAYAASQEAKAAVRAMAAEPASDPAAVSRRRREGQARPLGPSPETKRATILRDHAADTAKPRAKPKRVSKARQAQLDRAATMTRKADAKQKRRTGKVKQAGRSVLHQMRERHKRDMADAAESSAITAEKVFQEHGIRHSFRLFPKLAFLAALMLTYDRNGMLALQTLRECGMPSWRMAMVLQAALYPEGYTPTRDPRGKVPDSPRAMQRRYKYNGRQLGGGAAHAGLWVEGHRDINHPAAVRVICCAVFLWMAKTRRKNNGGWVHGFGRGLFSSMCRCSESAIFEHEDGMPGAMLALRQAGFIDYVQPDSDTVRDIDRGPSGHAYNMFWFPATAEDAAMEACLELVREIMLLRIGRVPLCEYWQQGERATPPKPPPPDPPFTNEQIPF